MDNTEWVRFSPRSKPLEEPKKKCPNCRNMITMKSIERAFKNISHRFLLDKAPLAEFALLVCSEYCYKCAVNYFDIEKKDKYE